MFKVVQVGQSVAGGEKFRHVDLLSFVAAQRLLGRWWILEWRAFQWALFQVFALARIFARSVVPMMLMVMEIFFVMMIIDAGWGRCKYIITIANVWNKRSLVVVVIQGSVSFHSHQWDHWAGVLSSWPSSLKSSCSRSKCTNWCRRQSFYEVQPETSHSSWNRGNCHTTSHPRI